MNTKSRVGEYFETYSGRPFWPRDPRPEDICLEDIAHHLSLVCRFGGAVKRHYSVGQHSIFVHRICPDEFKFEGLFHDATEAYLGDVVRPLKYSLHEYLEAEAKLQRVISRMYGVPEKKSPPVQLADDIALITERNALFRRKSLKWAADLERLNPSKVPILETTMEQTEDLWLFLAEAHLEKP